MTDRRSGVLRRPRIVLVPAVVVVVGAALVGGAAWRSAGRVDVGTPAPAVVALTADERAYHDQIAPRLVELAAQTRALADLGAERSRNLLAIQRGHDRVETLLGEIDRYHASHGVPERFRDAGIAYREGAARAREGMAEAQAGFRRFDWDRVGRATAIFAAGAQTLEEAVAALNRAVAAEPPPT